MGTAKPLNNTNVLLEGHVAPAVCATNDGSVEGVHVDVEVLLCGRPIEAIRLARRLFSSPAELCNSPVVRALLGPCASRTL